MRGGSETKRVKGGCGPAFINGSLPPCIIVLSTWRVRKGVVNDNTYTTGLVSRASDISQQRKHKACRFMQRFYTGFDVHEGETARWFVLTESNEAIERGLDIIQKFNELVRYLRRHYGPFEYCSVRHRQGDKKRINLHVVYFGEYIPQQIIGDWWWKNYASYKSKMGVVKNVKRQAWYLAKYLSGDDFERYHFSREWVFPGWIGFSKWFQKEFGQYPERERIVYLAKIGQEGREEDTWFGLYLLDNERTKKRDAKLRGKWLRGRL